MKSLVSDFNQPLPVFQANEEINPIVRQGYSYGFLSGNESDESKAKNYLKFVEKQINQGYKIVSGINDGVTRLIAGVNQNAVNTVQTI